MCSLLRIKLEISVCCTCLLHSIIWSPEWNSKQKLVLFLLWIVTMKDFRNAMSYDCCFFLSFLFFFSKLFLGNMNFWKIIFYFCGFNSSLLHFRNSLRMNFLSRFSNCGTQESLRSRLRMSFLIIHTQQILFFSP